VLRQGGRIWVEQPNAQGTVFCITLPVFSLPDMVDSVVQRARRVASPVSFVAIRVDSRAGWSSDEVRAENSQSVRDLLLRCLHSDLDVLLPKIGSAGAAEIFFILAITDQLGGQAIVKRIRRRMGRSEYFQQAGLTVATSYRLLEAIDSDTAESVDQSVAQVSAQIQECIDSELTSRKVTNAD
jgi:hypothetical protein